MICDCIVLTHARRCTKIATKRCTQCGDKLCGGCAKNHHAHSTFEPLNANATPAKAPPKPDEEHNQ